MITSTMRRVLAISPHLDDAVLSMGASLAWMANLGIQVDVHTLFAGAPSELSPAARTFHDLCGLNDEAVSHRRDEDLAAITFAQCLTSTCHRKTS